MIIGRTPYTVPPRHRAERLDVIVPEQLVQGRLVFRPVFCPCCGAHRTLLVDRFDWEPHPGVKHVECGPCGGAGAAGRGTVQ